MKEFWKVVVVGGFLFMLMSVSGIAEGITAIKIVSLILSILATNFACGKILDEATNKNKEEK